MKDFVLRLASMKLAEMKFEVIKDNYQDNGEEGDLEFWSLRKIKTFIKQEMKKENQSIHFQSFVPEESLWGTTIKAKYTHVFAIRKPLTQNFYYFRLHVLLPEEMNPKTFRKLMESL